MNSAANIQHEPAQGFQDIYEQHVDEAAFLWLLRSVALERPDYLPEDIAELERRIDAHLDGLMIAPEQAWHACEEALARGDGGEVFAATVTAFRSLDVTKMQKAVEVGLAEPHLFAGLTAALAWLPGKLCHSWIKRFLTSKDLDHKRLAIAACCARQEDPSGYLTHIVQREDCMGNEALQAQSYKAIGIFKRRDLRFALEEGHQSDSDSARFWALWSLALLGETDAAARLYDAVATPGPRQTPAVQLVFRALPLQVSRQWVTNLLREPQSEQLAIQAIAAIADPHAIPWLIGCMRTPALARRAGEAFTFITGIDLVRYGLAIELPENIEELPNDDPADDRVQMDEDQYLPWPDVDKVAAVWQQYGARYQAGSRYFLGQPLAAASLHRVFQSGSQRHRKAAAMELALLEPNEILRSMDAKSGGVAA